MDFILNSVIDLISKSLPNADEIFVFLTQISIVIDLIATLAFITYYFQPTEIKCVPCEHAQLDQELNTVSCTNLSTCIGELWRSTRSSRLYGKYNIMITEKKLDDGMAFFEIK